MNFKLDIKIYVYKFIFQNTSVLTLCLMETCLMKTRLYTKCDACSRLALISYKLQHTIYYITHKAVYLIYKQNNASKIEA